MVKNSQDSNPLKGVRSFGQNDTKKGEDTDGHGTDVMRLLLKVAPEADYYVAKISRTKQDKDENATKNIISVRIIRPLSCELSPTKPNVGSGVGHGGRS